MVDESRSKFLYASINDIQATIRAMDFKANVLLLVLFVPISRFPDLSHAIRRLTGDHLGASRYVFLAVTTAVACFWAASLFLIFSYVGAVHNPSTHVTGNRPRGTFYSPTLFSVKLWNIESSRSPSSRSIDEHLEQLPNSEDEVCRELAFEQMKLVYIRSRKMALIKWGYTCTAIAGMLGVVLATLAFVF